MMKIQRRRCTSFLRDYISHFELRELTVLNRRGVRPIPARPSQMLVFHLRATAGCDLLDHRTGQVVPTPSAGVMGPQTFRAVDALWLGNFRLFVVVFGPTGFHRLVGVPMVELANRVYDASELLGGSVRQLHEELHGAAGLEQMAQIAEAYFNRMAERARRFHPVQIAAAEVIARHGSVCVDKLARTADLSVRQFERKFAEQVGMPPKLYCRVSRLSFLMRLKEAEPHRTWTDLTYLAGYFDQNHLVKEFKALAGAAPSEFFRLIVNGFTPDRAGENAQTSDSY